MVDIFFLGGESILKSLRGGAVVSLLVGFFPMSVVNLHIHVSGVSSSFVLRQVWGRVLIR